MAGTYMSYEALIKMFEENADDAVRVEGPTDIQMNWPRAEAEPEKPLTFEIWKVGSHYYLIQSSSGIRPVGILPVEEKVCIVYVLVEGEYRYFGSSGDMRLGDSPEAIDFDDFADW